MKKKFVFAGAAIAASTTSPLVAEKKEVASDHLSSATTLAPEDQQALSQLVHFLEINDRMHATDDPSIIEIIPPSSFHDF